MVPSQSKALTDGTIVPEQIESGTVSVTCGLRFTVKVCGNVVNGPHLLVKISMTLYIP